METQASQRQNQITSWCLYGIAILAILAAHSLGSALQPKIPMGNDVFMSNPEDSRAIETNVRIVGGIFFAAGLMERLFFAITSAKHEPNV